MEVRPADGERQRCACGEGGGGPDGMRGRELRSASGSSSAPPPPDVPASPEHLKGFATGGSSPGLPGNIAGSDIGEEGGDAEELP